MATFDLLVVGSGGGPAETDLSAYLFKPASASWDDGIVAIEAGSGQGALSSLLKTNPGLFGDATHTASMIYSLVRCYLITHAHLDHVSSLVLSAGTLGGPRKRIYASKKTLEDLESVFSDRIWPNLASWNEEDEAYKLLYTILPSNPKFHAVFPDVSVKSFAVNHGRNEGGNYDSAAFFIRYDPTGKSFLFFGDVEPDSVAPKARTINVWRAAAPMIPETLSTIFIECSWPSGRDDALLYGHLNPEHLAVELTALAKEVVLARTDQIPGPLRPQRKRQKRNPLTNDDLKGALSGVRVFIIHCKDSQDELPDKPIRDVIVEQVKGCVEPLALGVEVLAAKQGMSIRKSLFSTRPATN